MNSHVKHAGLHVTFLFCSVVCLTPSLVLAVATLQNSTAPAAENHDGPAELPREYVKSSVRDTPATGKVISVRAGEDPSQAIEQASCGDIIQLQAGATFGPIMLPEKKCDDSHWIILRTSAPDSKLPAEGTRVTPCFGGVASLPGRPEFKCTSTENVLAKIQAEGRGSAGAILVEAGANHYRLIGLEVTRAESPAVVYNLVGPHKGGAADHLVFDRMWIHGTAHNETVRGVMLSHFRYAAVVDSYVNDFHCIARTGNCVDSQAIAGGLGEDPMGPYKIVNNFLEAAAECILFGGDRAATTPADIEIRHNHFFKPMTWMMGEPGFVGGADGSPFIVKNLFEIKNAERVLLEGNVMENAWGGFSQVGTAILLGPKNQAIGMMSVCPLCKVTDITIRYSRISHVGGGFQLGNGLSPNKAAAKDGGRYSIHDVVVDDIQVDRYNGRGVFAQISTAPGVTAATPLHDVAIDHVTAFPPRVLFNMGGPRGDPRMSGLTITNSIFAAADSPVTSTGGGPEKNCAAGPGSRNVEVVLHSCFVSYRFDHNVIIGGGGGWPKGNETPRRAADVGFSNYANGNGGDYHLSSQSKFRHTGADGKDPGADVDAIERATDGAQ
jgi:hypothetical protein